MCGMETSTFDGFRSWVESLGDAARKIKTRLDEAEVTICEREAEVTRLEKELAERDEMLAERRAQYERVALTVKDRDFVIANLQEANKRQRAQLEDLRERVVVLSGGLPTPPPAEDLGDAVELVGPIPPKRVVDDVVSDVRRELVEKSPAEVTLVVSDDAAFDPGYDAAYLAAHGEG